MKERARTVVKIVSEAILTFLVIGAWTFVSLLLLGPVADVSIIIGALVVFSVYRTFLLSLFAGKEFSWRGAAKRICVDSAFSAFLLLLTTVIPAAQYFANILEERTVVAALTALGWYLTVVSILLAAALLRAGYWAALDSKTLEEAIVESVRKYARKRWVHIKKLVVYASPYVILLIGNWLSMELPGVLSVYAAYATIVAVLLVSAPLSEWIYARLMKGR